MLDSGIDVKQVANLVFFKPVYSKIKFWQMIGRGTRLCPNLFGPGDKKADFRIFDFCSNFDFFKEKTKGIEGKVPVPLATRLFRRRVRLLGHLQQDPDADLSEGSLADYLATNLHREVASMNRDNFIVHMRLEAVEHFRQRQAWDRLSDIDQKRLDQEIAELPSQTESEDIRSRLFDLTVLKMQLARAEGDVSAFESYRRRIIDISMLLEDKKNISAVADQLEYLADLQESTFWEGLGLDDLEDLRLRLRDLVPFLDRKKQNIVYTDFQDEIIGVRPEEDLDLPKMTGGLTPRWGWRGPVLVLEPCLRLRRRVR